MAKEYIEREAVAKKAICMHGFGNVKYVPLSAIMNQTAADVVEVFRPDEAVLAEFEDDYEDFKKIKTHIAQIIVEGKVEKPYYSILWWDEESKEYNIGYSSYCLDYVRKWLELVFEVVEEADAVEVVHGRWIKLDMHKGIEQFKCSICRSECYVPTCMGEPMYAFCPNCGNSMDGERRTDNGNKENL